MQKNDNNEVNDNIAEKPDEVSAQNFLKLQELDAMSYDKLTETARKLNIDPAGKIRAELKEEITEAYSKQSGFFKDTGILEIVRDNENPGLISRGYLRHNFASNISDTYVSVSQIKLFALRDGDSVTGVVRPPKDNERHRSLLKIELVNGMEPDKQKQTRKPFEEQVAVYPDERYEMELTKAQCPRLISESSLRIIDMFAPIGKGQRGLIVAPPKAGKTTLLKDMANSFATKYPESILIILLIDERPEEVTDMRRSVINSKYPENVIVVASTFDETPDRHLWAASMVINRAKRLTESGKDVIILLDSITRLTRSSNIQVQPSGRTLSGGIDPAALTIPKKLIGAARNIENGGSLTIIATALVDTGSKMDDAIFEEFKATGNMELILDRSLAEQRLFPAIDILKSGTRHDELLYKPSERVIRELVSEFDTKVKTNSNQVLIRFINHAKSKEDFITTFIKEKENLINKINAMAK
ncbi:MAG: transcription termination factor Rho [Abditibacteriota bacterium]|nr:transcription termination factor Rho [Abditibacteriota bacterium]